MKEKIKNMQELAKKLHLSRCTVSYILNNRWRENRIRPETAEKVLNYVKEVEFIPNSLSMTLKGKAIKDIAILLPTSCLDHQKKAFFDFLRIIEKENFTYMVFPLKSTDENLNIVNQLTNYKIKNVIIISGLMRPDEMTWWANAIANQESMRWLFYDFRFDTHKQCDLPSDNVTYIGYSNLKANKLIYHYIADAGYKHIIVGKSVLNNPELLSFIEGIGLIPDSNMCYRWPTAGNTLFDKGKLIAEQILKLPKPKEKTAVYINDDCMTIAAIEHMRQAGADITNKYAFISWDGLPESNYFQPPLTTLTIPHADMLVSTAKWLKQETYNTFIEVTPTIRPGKSLIPYSND